MAEPERTRTQIVGRAIVAGVLAGGVTGLVVGTLSFPILGTCLGTAAGMVSGAALGALNGAVLALLARWTRYQLVFAVAAGLICGVGVVVGATLGYGGWQQVPTSGWQPPLFLAWCVGLGVVLGPAVVRTRGRMGGGLTRIGLFAAYGASGAAVVGSVAGLAVGLAAYPPTAPFALIEGALLASTPGAVIGALAAFVTTRRPADVR